jgi:hypothetical protein
LSEKCFPYFFRVHLNILDTVVSSYYAIFGTPVYLSFFRKLKFMLDFIFTVFRVIESFMDGTVKEQRLHTKNVNAKKVNTAKIQVLQKLTDTI